MLGKAWTWTIETAGKAWDWMTNTTWKEKWDDIKSWMQDGWEWTVDLAGGAWEWMEKKSPELTGKLETAWQWSASVANDLMQWIIDVAWPWIRDAAVTTWEWSVEAANDSFNWVVNTAAPWIGKTVSSTWDWTVNGVNEIKNIQLDDNALAQAAAMAIKATIEWTGDTYEAIKEGFQTGDWSNALGIATDLFKAGISIWAVLELMSGTVSSLKTAISTGLGLAKAAGAMAAAGVGGTAGMLGILSIGIGLVEAWNTGDYEGFVENMLTSVLAAMVAFGLTGNVVVGATVFTLTFNMELGEIIANGLMTKFDKSIMSPIRNFFGIGINQPYMDAMNNPSFTPGTSLESREASNWEKFKDFLGFASGGFVSGPGTDTSDSIPAMLSNGEFVINAKATRQFLPILKAINSGNFGGFKIGGQVSQSVPAGVANTWALKAAGLEDNKALSYLAQIAEDSQSFGYIVDMVSGFQGMRADYEKQMEKLKEQQAEIQGQLKEELEKLQKDIEDQTNTFQASIKDLSGSLAGFANNLASITGSKTAGLVGGVLGQVGGFMDSYKNFGNATNLMGQLTSGFGMANAVLGAVGAFKSFNDARNQEARQQWQEQMNLDKEQLDAIKQIEYNTKETTANLVKYLAQNPTNSNIAGGKAVLDNVYNSLRSNLRPNFGRISYNVEEDDVWFDDEKTVRYGPEQFLRKMGIGTSGSLGNMGVDELQNVYNQVRGISHGQLKGVAQDIADTMDAGWAGSGELKRWSTNFGSFKSKLGNYLNTLKDLESTLGSLQQNTRLEGFAGVEFLNASERVDAYRKQVEDFFKASGKNISSHQKEIDQMVSEYANKVVDGGERIITIMQDVRGSFIQAFSGGETALNSFASAVRPFFDTMKSNIASLFYDIDADSLDAQFKKFFGNFTDKLANYSGNNIMGYVQNLLGNGQLDKLFNQMISLQNIAEDMADINTLIAEQFREQAQNAGLTKEEIDGLLEQMGLLSQEAEQVAAYMDELKNSLKSAMSAAMESGDLIDFSKTLGESIYENAKEGLIQAFMESEVYQEMFKKWFDSSELALTGNLEQDFDNMNDMLDQLRQELNEAGLNFGFGDVPTGGDTGGSDDYYVPTGEGEPAKIVENHYHYDPRIQNLYGDDKETLFEEFLSWKEDQENSSA
jgi:Sec-independent protein translocase protein TatA